MIPAIQQAQDCARTLLQPSPRDLEHGLELHRQSVVIDTYGFGPSAAEDADTFLAALDAGASIEELKTLRETMAMTRAATDARERAEFEAAWTASGVTCTVRNAGEEGQSAWKLLGRLAHFVYLCDFLRGFCPKAVVPDDIPAAQRAGRHCYLLTCNGVPLAERWQTVEEELAFLPLFFQLGCRMMHLTYNRRNMLGDGCAESANGGLSDLGRRAIAEMNRLGVVVDVAHSGWRTSREAAQASTRPIVASHTVCDALNHGCRAKPDDVIRAIVDGGGLIGICGIPSFLGGDGTIRALLDHVAYVVKTFGADAAAIGTDTAYTSSASPFKTRIEPRMPRRRERFESFWPPKPAGAGAGFNQPRQVLSLNWVNWPLFTVGLVQRGLADDAIRKIIGGNMLRVLRANAPAAATPPAPLFDTPPVGRASDPAADQNV